MYNSLKARRYCRKNHPIWIEQFPDDEWYNIITKRGRSIGKAPRSICHSGPYLLHQVVHLQVFDNKNKIYLQKRSMNKKVQPGKWDSAVGGHVDLDENIEDALFRESMEELGIGDFHPTALGNYIWEYEVESEKVHTFTCQWTGVITPEPSEIEEGRFWTAREIESSRDREIFTPNFLWEWDNIIKKKKEI